jgi:hypothetical protein
MANADDFLTLIFLEELLNWLLVVDDFFALLEDAFVSLLVLKKTFSPSYSLQ